MTQKPSIAMLSAIPMTTLARAGDCDQITDLYAVLDVHLAGFFACSITLESEGIEVILDADDR